MFGKFFDRLSSAFCAFPKSRDGNVAMMFALLLIPLVGAMGAAVDYSRANSVKSDLQAALDATALLLSKDASGLNAKQLAQKANEYVRLQLGRLEAQDIKVTPTYTGKKGGESTLTVAGVGTVETTFMRLLGVPQLRVDASSQVSWGLRKLEVVLALDNTGSMKSSGKIEALKVAAHQFVDTVTGSTRNEREVKISIVPFDTRVNVGTAEQSQPWFDWSTMSGSSSSSASASSGGTTTGASSGGSGAPAGWNGCIIDRTQDYDVLATKPKKNDVATLYPAVANCNLASILPLTNNWAAVDAKIDEMKASGNTNTTIGFTWAWNMLTPGVPFSAAAQPAPNLDKVIVFMTDGMNTENRWSTTAAEIDARTKIVCNNIKSAAVKVYTIRVMEGNASLLQNCASDPSMYFEVSQANDLIAVFNKIAGTVASLRISR
jgi:Flp pilus assembly protein TadG